MVNIVADRINLLSHLGQKDFDLTDQPNYVSIENQSYINTEAFSMVLGEVLNEFLGEVKNCLQNHTHPYPNMSPTLDQSVQRVVNFDLDKILSKYIKLDG